MEKQVVHFEGEFLPRDSKTPCLYISKGSKRFCGEVAVIVISSPDRPNFSLSLCETHFHYILSKAEITEIPSS